MRKLMVIFFISALLFIGTALFVTVVIAFGSFSQIDINSLHLVSFFPSAVLGLIACSVCFFTNIGISKVFKINNEKASAFLVSLLVIEVIAFYIVLYKIFFFIGGV